MPEPIQTILAPAIVLPPVDPAKPPSQLPVAPTTTIQEDITKAGQRKVNLIWEYTQSAIAVVVTLAYIYSQLVSIDSAGLANACFLIVGFYFSRTNHAAIGGIGMKPTPEYQGR